MRKNRKIPKRMSVIAKTSMRFGTIIVCFVIMVILNHLSSSSCNQLLKQKGEMERELVRLEDSRTREALRWEEMKTPENIERALHGNGLSMKFPRPNQTIVMMSNGLPRPGQISLAQAKMRRESMVVRATSRASSSEPSSVRTSYRRGVRR